jgi:DNA polymerase-3 subunit alpha
MVRLLAPLASGGEAALVAGRDFILDADLARRIEQIAGEGAVELSVQEPPRLALVS